MGNYMIDLSKVKKNRRGDEVLHTYLQPYDTKIAYTFKGHDGRTLFTRVQNNGFWLETMGEHDLDLVEEKPEPKLYWRRHMKGGDGRIITDCSWYESKEAFESNWRGYDPAGPWESREFPEDWEDEE